VRHELAECLTAQSHYREALAVLRQCGAEAATIPRLVAVRAECLWGLRRGREARDLLERALAEGPGGVELLRLRARLHLEAGAPRAGAGRLERIAADRPRDHASRYQLAQAYERLGRSRQAAEQRRLVDQTEKLLLQLTRLVQEAGDRPWDAALRRRAAG